MKIVVLVNGEFFFSIFFLFLIGLQMYPNVFICIQLYSGLKLYSYVSGCFQGSNCIHLYPNVFNVSRCIHMCPVVFRAQIVLACIGLYSDVSECIQCIQLYLGHKLYLYVSGCFQGSNCTQMYQNVSRCNHMYLSVFKCICRYPKYPSVFKSVQLCMNVSKCIRMYLNVFACIQMCSLCLVVF